MLAFLGEEVLCIRKQPPPHVIRCKHNAARTKVHLFLLPQDIVLCCPA